MNKSKTYQAALSSSEVVAGMNAARCNARRLAADAELLLAGGRWPSAASLAILSIEESGKFGLLRRLSFAADPRALTDRWREYRSHQAKLKVPIGINPEGKSLSEPASATAAIESQKRLVSDLDLFKQRGFYTDCIPDDAGQAVWIEPSRQITERQAREVVACARLSVPKVDVSIREIDLLVEHVGSFYGTPRIIEGWRSWLAAMESETATLYS
jgi:AbiV family abortive infection protein